MARSFLGIPINTYQQNLTSFPSQLCGQKGIVIPVRIDWSLYNASSAAPSQNVIVNLLGNAAQAVLKDVRSVYIDNTNSNVPIYVFFPDTGHTISCAPSAEGWFPVYTNGQTAWIVGEGFVTTQIPVTLVLFTNIFVQPFTNYELAQSADLWKASPAIQTGAGKVFNPNFGVPALGDQLFQVDISLAPGTVDTPIPQFGPFAAPNFVYIKQIYVISHELENNGNAAQAAVHLQNSVDGLIYTARASGGNTATGVINGAPNEVLADIHGNMKFNAQSNWVLHLDAATANVIGGAMDWTFVFTQSPV